MIALDRDRDSLRLVLGPFEWTRVGRVVSAKLGPLTFRRIGHMWVLGWRWA